MQVRKVTGTIESQQRLFRDGPTLPEDFLRHALASLSGSVGLSWILG